MMSGCVRMICGVLPWLTRFKHRELRCLNNILVMTSQQTKVNSDATFVYAGVRFYGIVKEVVPQKQSVTRAIVEPDHDDADTSGQISTLSVDNRYIRLYEGIKDLHMKPAIPAKSFNLAVYVNESDTLSNLVKLGVALSRVEKRKEDANYIMKMDFENEVRPYLTFLVDMGIQGDDLGAVITRNPALFQEDLDNLHVRMNYLESKKFSVDGISQMIRRAPAVLSLTTKQIDTQLGYLQREFKLSGDEVRTAVTRYPKLVIWDPPKLKQNKFNIQEYLGFTEQEQKQLLMEFPKIYTSGETSVTARFDYIHNMMKIPHELIMKWPRIFGTRTHIIQHRHTFLSHQGRHQYDPTKPNYVSLKALVTGTDAEFCQNVAKAWVIQYNDFLKTL